MFARENKIANSIKNVKKKLKDEKNTTWANSMPQLNNLKSKYEKYVKDNDMVIESLFETVYNEYKLLRQFLSDNPSDPLL